MKRDMVQRVIGFVFRYIGLFCALLIVLEAVSTLHSAKLLTQQTARGVLQSVSGEISGRVDGVLRMLTGLSMDPRLADDDLSLFDRAMLTQPYRESYGLYAIGVTDEEIHAVTTSTRQPPVVLPTLAYRSYMRQMYATGEYQITDAFPAGLDGVTMNYTIAVPILEDGMTVGGVFGAIYFEDIEAILERSSDETRQFCLLGSGGTVMAGGGTELYGQELEELTEGRYYFRVTPGEPEADLRTGTPSSVWSWGPEGVAYTTGCRVEPTDWNLQYTVRFAAVVARLLPVMLLKSAFYIVLCLAIFIFGRRYLREQLDAASHLVERVTALQREVFQSDGTDYDALLELTQQGLTDQLTGLATRTVLLSRMEQVLGTEDCCGAVCFLDLDDLKSINDGHGHEAGDCALVCFAQVLRRYEQRRGGVSARYGGDEFILMLDGVAERDIPHIADGLQAALNVSTNCRGEEIAVRGSMGIACYPRHGCTVDALIGKADLALCAAKAEGKNRWVLYEEPK